MQEQNVSRQLIDQALSSGDYCSFLNITVISKLDDVNYLVGKFAILDSSRNTSSMPAITVFMEFLFPSLIHQYIVANCSFLVQQQQLMTNAVQILNYWKSLGMFTSFGWYITVPGVVALLGTFLNLSLLAITFWRMPFAKMFNWLIAFDSACQILVVAPFIVNLFAESAQVDSIDFRVCLGILMVSTTGSFASFLTLFIISAERLLNVLFPFRMSWIAPKRLKLYAFLSCIISFLFGFVMTVSVYNVRTTIDLPFNNLLYCNTGLFSDTLNVPITYVLIALTVLNYVIILLIVYIKHRTKISKQTHDASGQDLKTLKRMLRSVIAITTVLILGFLIASTFRNQIALNLELIIQGLIRTAYSSDPKLVAVMAANWTTVLVGVITCIPLIASSSNALVLYVTSSEYRKAYIEAFRKWFSCCLLCRCLPNPTAAIAPKQQQENIAGAARQKPRNNNNNNAILVAPGGNRLINNNNGLNLPNMVINEPGYSGIDSILIRK